eukprot:23762-Prymnesium_polylepis.1
MNSPPALMQRVTSACRKPLISRPSASLAPRSAPSVGAATSAWSSPSKPTLPSSSTAPSAPHACH